jgi:hypothetical protein
MSCELTIDSYDYLGSMKARLLTLFDGSMLQRVDAEDLWPIEVDEEFITEETILPQAQDRLCLMTGFNTNFRLFWLSVTDRVEDSTSRVSAVNMHEALDPVTILASLERQIQDLRRTALEMDARFCRWNDFGVINSVATDTLAHVQLEIMRANIHVTRLWLESTLLENLERIEKDTLEESSWIRSPESVWTQRQEICQQLLFVLSNVKQHSLEPNGNSLVSVLSTPVDFFKLIGHQ